jgi:nitrite reductase (NADH) small subunit
VLVLTFQVDGRHNCATVDGAPYVYARTEQGSFLLPARCPHRGGPLHLATVEQGTGRLICPWHDRPTSTTRLRKSAPPAVRSGNKVTAVFAVGADASHQLEHRPRSAGLDIPGRRQVAR